MTPEACLRLVHALGPSALSSAPPPTPLFRRETLSDELTRSVVERQLGIV